MIKIEYSYSSNALYIAETATTQKEAVKEALGKLGHLRQADLRGFDLTGLDLTGADLTDANLTRANLTGANLTGANLTDADLTDANLTRANLTDANLTDADLTDADLTGANLTRANLTGADLTGANLTRADLTGANLTRANLTRANLTRADLTRANLTGADLTRANLTEQKLKDIMLERWILPEEGSFTGWKSVRVDGVGVIAKLEIPAEAKRTCNIKNRKCRAEFVRVLEFQGLDGSVLEGVSEACSYNHDSDFIYTLGEIARPDSYDSNMLIDCTNGIHFWITRQEAINWITD